MVFSVMVWAIVFKAHVKGWLNWIWAGILATVLPYLILVIIQSVLFQSVSQAIFVNRVNVLVCQIIAAMVVFYLSERNDSFGSWISAGVLGGILVIFIVPFVVLKII